MRSNPRGPGDVHGLNFGPRSGAHHTGWRLLTRFPGAHRRRGELSDVRRTFAQRRARGRAVLRSLGQRPVTGSDEDPRVAGLRTAVSRLRRELAAHPVEFPDRGIAEDELAALAAMAVGGVPEIPRLRRSLLLIAGAIGSVSALARGLADVRGAVELFGEPPRRG
ncbi:hypothetical protein SAVERM_1998 [Streptomyces avermitilis MA-4680 = NBRC 14893]|uniref:Uncharacterized protein n=1 Tax=Streptomyces avermitilis (strain ATCC 31267 / DSM 46492 / JCM 5070 / NBRC 14893 / NCIMB 12804 / NRRL 8165 / MA-4680) TaxID=227882 RepID=Q82LL2_STRAW|nr:hypothetical protein SAVERM_1998 [Streptomyces avermitilis MA-4680 = NBRC 14893]